MFCSELAVLGTFSLISFGLVWFGLIWLGSIWFGSVFKQTIRFGVMIQ
jgi:hypothetical protein